MSRCELLLSKISMMVFCMSCEPSFNSAKTVSILPIVMVNKSIFWYRIWRT